jgi:hypothetical protein
VAARQLSSGVGANRRSRMREGNVILLERSSSRIIVFFFLPAI